MPNFGRINFSELKTSLLTPNSNQRKISRPIGWEIVTCKCAITPQSVVLYTSKSR